MQRITPRTAAALFGVAASRRIETTATQGLAPHTLMHRAGLAVARLAMAIAPHARSLWVACGPGNNGGDGFEAAAQLRQHGYQPTITFSGDESCLPADAHDALTRARGVGVPFSDTPPAQYDVAIDALLGLGTTRAPEGVMMQWLAQMRAGPAPLISVDLPSGLNAETGVDAAGSAIPSHDLQQNRYCLNLLTLKPGVFTAHGRDLAGEVWFDDLGCRTDASEPLACLPGQPPHTARPHASHKGSYGDVAVIGGAPGMVGAAILAATAALHQGAGRVFVGLLDADPISFDPTQPELMFRRIESLDLRTMTVVCGCGGGMAVQAVLPQVLLTAPRLVLDADALNAIAADSGLQQQLRERPTRGGSTVLTPHPLEAARLLQFSTAAVQADRLAAASSLARRFAAVVVLKGSGSIIASEDRIPFINPTGNARLATPGTGDVLAGMVGAALAAGDNAFDAAWHAVWRHGRQADEWPVDRPLTAGLLAHHPSPT